MDLKHLVLKKVYSFTSAIHTKSEKVMQKIDMIKAGEFDHPNIPPESILCKHVLYKIENKKIGT